MQKRCNKLMKRILAVALTLCMVLGVVPGEMRVVKKNETQAATFEDINQSSVFLKQAPGSVTCTLVSAAMLIRRAAMMSGNSNWSSITESSLQSTAWINGSGLSHNFTYAGITVSYGADLGGSTDKLISLLNEHPEGIVIYNRSLPHAILVTDYSNGTFYCADPSPYYPSGRIAISQATFNVGSATCYWYVSNPDVNLQPFDYYSPEGGVESLVGGKGQIWLNGWTFDRDDWTSAVTIEVYIGGESVGAYTANLERTDVGTAYPGAGNYHGFDLTIGTSKTGTQRVEIWAKSIGGDGKILLGANDVYIEPSDSSAPVFQSVKVVEMDAYGYFVECEVTDDSGIVRVMCPTWTENNGQDDLAANWENTECVKATLNDGVYSFRVNVSEHNNEYGDYYTHLYAYDTSGNSSVYHLLVTVTNEKMPKRIARYGDSLYSVYEDGLSWDGAVSFAKSMGSNLVSINDNKENDVVYNLINGLYKYGYYIGGYSTSKTDSYKWTDGSLFEYSNWAVGEPSYTNDEEFYACMVNGGKGIWNDVGTALIDGTSLEMGFVIETPLGLKESMVLETETKIYKYYDISLSYNLAKKYCEENGGYLACITSEEENELIASKLHNDNFYYYIGANDVDVEGEFCWINGETFTYTNWSSGDPNSSKVNDCNEEYVGIDCNGKWRDMTGQGTRIGFIAEFDKDITLPESSETPNESKNPSIKSSEEPNIPTSSEKPEIPSETPDENTPPSSEDPSGQPDDEPTSDNPSQSQVTPGDIDANTLVELRDAQLALRMALLLENNTTDAQMEAADVDKNGQVELKDAQQILRKALLLIDEFEKAE